MQYLKNTRVILQTSIGKSIIKYMTGGFSIINNCDKAPDFFNSHRLCRGAEKL